MFPLWENMILYNKKSCHSSSGFTQYIQINVTLTVCDVSASGF